MTLQPGCYIDSHHGHYCVPMVIELAAEHGFIVDPFVRFALDHYNDCYHETDYPGEALIEVSDEAIDWLNQHEGLPGHWWMWNDGDFGLYAEEDVD